MSYPHAPPPMHKKYPSQGPPRPLLASELLARDIFAAHALPGVLREYSETGAPKIAYEVADRMLAARDAGKEE